MSTITATLTKIRAHPSPSENSTANPFRLVSTIGEPAEVEDINAAWPACQLPADVLELWENCGEARLFEDADYGQWGLALLSPRDSARLTTREREERPADFRTDDIVLGEFLGDQELLVFAPSEVRNRRILVALPLDHRADWFGAARNLAEFLERYIESDGEKYWESEESEQP